MKEMQFNTIATHQSSDMEENLKPCPFCGGTAKLEDHRLCWFVRCSGCTAGLIGDRAPEPDESEEFPDGYWEGIRQSAIDRWNLRHQPVGTVASSPMHLENEERFTPFGH